MQALKSYLTPQRKKARLESETDLDADSDMSEADVDGEDKQKTQESTDQSEPEPDWVQRQDANIQKILATPESMKATYSGVQSDLAQVKLQAGLAQSVAEDAMDRITELEDRITLIEENSVSKAKVEEMIDIALAKGGAWTPLPGPNAAGKVHTMTSDDEKHSRTVVVGGFPQDSSRDHVVKSISDIAVKNMQGVDEIYAFRYGSVGFIRFDDKETMFRFLKDINAKPKLQVDGKSLWFSVSKSPDERRKGRILSKYKRVFLEVDVVAKEDIRIGYRRGIIMIKNVRIGEWSGDGATGRVALHQGKLKDVGIDVDVKKVDDAVKELLSE